MAGECSSCGAKKGQHLNGCPKAGSGGGDKRGGSPGGKQNLKPVGKAAQNKCLNAWGNDHIAEHPGRFHLCLQDRGHSGKHKCTACPKEE